MRFRTSTLALLSRRRWLHINPRTTRMSSTLSELPQKTTTYPYKLTVGSVTKVVAGPPRTPELVPKLTTRVSRLVTGTDLKHLEWMLKKDRLGQDMFLIGPPGKYKRRVVKLYGYLTGREVQFVQISRDTTEADIKQRREIIDKSAVFFDQPSVRCALSGHVLVLDGIEKAERNVLPLLNNLLENREMQLEDGRHLIPHSRYDALLQEFGADAIARWKLERVHQDFRVIALGLPVPTFKGNPLDPPLRSRFQARNVDGFTRDEVEAIVKDVVGGEGRIADSVRKIIDLGFALNFAKNREFKEFNDSGTELDALPWFVGDNAIAAASIMKTHEAKRGAPPPLRTVFEVAYPFTGKRIDMLASEHIGSEHEPVQLPPPSSSSSNLLVSQRLTLDLLHTFLTTEGTERGALVYGPQGSGKSWIVDSVARDLGRRVCHIQVYKDMSTRDLFQNRTTDHEGNTVWRNSALTEAAVRGEICVLDGVENLHESVFNVIGKLVQDGDVLMPDGVSRLISSSSDEEGEEKVHRVHPDFRVIGIGNSADLKITPEMSSVLLGFRVGFEDGDEEKILAGVGDHVLKVLSVCRELRKRADGGDKGCAAIARTLNITQVKRIGRRCANPESDLYSDVFNAALGMFLPLLERETLRDVLGEARIKKPKDVMMKMKRAVVVENRVLRIGDTSAPVFPDNEHKPKVPEALFFDIDQHVGVLERLLQDYLAGDHLLLIGNQGVGKNKLVDRLLMLLNLPREYVQLHRDTTVQSLTTIQRVEEGVVRTEDSPLVTAARHGLVLVVDEADKAPAHVTAVLKTLAERGEMLLPDGRRITRDPSSLDDPSSTIKMHENFRMIVLANRPGFPFLGNNFYSVLSHLFSVNPISNPTIESEVQLLRSYGPNVPEEHVQKIASAFAELRAMSDDGIISYPYSTREAVHIVKHLEEFPGDVNGAFGNVFDFDQWSDEVWKLVGGVLTKFFGENVIGVGESAPSELKIEEGVGDTKGFGGEGGDSSRTDFQFKDPKIGQVDPTGAAHVGGSNWAGGTGGMGTAGLGGAGGPFRLSDGNPVFQVSAEAKNSVPPDIRQKAREMARKMFEQKLRELRMSEHDGRMYEEILGPIRPQIQSLRTVLESLQSKSKDRKWVRHQTSGDLDDGKLIEGIVGEKNIYRMRKDENPEVGDPILKPKLMRLIVDCSGSMYRFNGYDKRLDRMLQSVLMVMEAFSSFGDIFKYEVYVHSGDDYDLKIIDKDKPPQDDKTRLEVLKTLFLHSQFCSSGDHTLESTVHGVKGLRDLKEEADELFLVVLSDANLERYGIRPEEFGRVLKMDNDVKCFAVFIGSLGDQAERICEGLPPGLGFVCLDTSRLPKILQRIFVESVLGDAA